MSKVNRKIAIAGLLSLVLLMSACSGKSGNDPAQSSAAGETGQASASAEPEKKETITLSFFDKNTGDQFNNPVAQEITKRTGITFQIQQPTGNPDEKLNLMLTSNDLPDIVLMDRRSDIVNKYIAAGALVPLE